MSSKSRGSFIISLDCEGLWGMVDNPSAIGNGVISQASLAHAYEHIVSTLGRNNLIATAAFVSSFACPVHILRDNLAHFEAMAEIEPIWFSPIVERLKNGKLDGWCGSTFYETMKSAGFEMAWHGATHLPLSEATSKAAVNAELQLAAQLHDELGRNPTTVIFPRNKVGHLALLSRAGFRVYRDGPKRHVLGKASNLLDEFNIYSPSEMTPPAYREGWFVCPPGHFLNWPKGSRGIIPAKVTVMRWKSMLRDAAERGGSVHMWFHPHNFVTAPKMLALFEEVTRFASELVRIGELSNPTMAESVFLPK